MTKARYPINIDTADWGPFNPASLTDQMCERERRAFTDYILTRLRKQPKTGSDDAAIWTGAMMAIVQLVYATNGNVPSDNARDAIHKAIDFSWLQCASMCTEPEAMN